MWRVFFFFNRERIVWIASFLVLGLTIFVNRSMPHGPITESDDVICQNDERGPCNKQYREEVRLANIPGWAKNLRENGFMIWMGLTVLAFYLSSKKVE